MKFLQMTALIALAFSSLLLHAAEDSQTLHPTRENTLYRRIVLPERLPAGNYWITTEIRADSPSPNAGIAVYTEMEPRAGEHPSP